MRKRRFESTNVTERARQFWVCGSPADLSRKTGRQTGDPCPRSSRTFIRKLRILDGVEFIEAPSFTAMVADYLEDDEYRALQLFLAGDPEAGSVMPGTGGFRKLRWADRRRGKGKRGGLRVI